MGKIIVFIEIIHIVSDIFQQFHGLAFVMDSNQNQDDVKTKYSANEDICFPYQRLEGIDQRLQQGIDFFDVCSKYAWWKFFDVNGCMDCGNKNQHNERK